MPMTVSVLIATFNSSSTIRATLDSVFGQTRQPDEVLVLDDGSTDDTTEIVRSYGSRITLLPGQHEGVACARNKLCSRATGDFLAFLDSDDIWHPQYLEYQLGLVNDYPRSIAFFTGHVDFHGTASFTWGDNPFSMSRRVEVIEPHAFFRLYNATTGTFGSMSYCCVPSPVIRSLGPEPFQTNGADDFYMFNRIAPRGAVVYASAPLVAYRIAAGSISSDRVVNYGQRVLAFEMLAEYYRQVPDRRLRIAFRRAFSSHRRLFSKFLMGAGQTAEARRQLRQSLRCQGGLKSFAKSMSWLFLTHCPAKLQPAWPVRHRKLPA